MNTIEAMTTNRIYKTRKSVAQAIEELKALQGKQFHPEVVVSAAEALKDVVIDNAINQLPKTKLEEERFAYFYKDTLCEIYNHDYLDVVLLKNSYNHEYNYLSFITLKEMSAFNKQHGWKKGDEVLRSLAGFLEKFTQESVAFRVFGDDFVLLSKEKIDEKELEALLDKSLKPDNIPYAIKYIDLTQTVINSVDNIEKI